MTATIDMTAHPAPKGKVVIELINREDGVSVLLSESVVTPGAFDVTIMDIDSGLYLPTSLYGVSYVAAMDYGISTVQV